MNIFVLDLNPKKAAQYHCDKHVIKMILESAQMLSTVLHEMGEEHHHPVLYKPTHKNHPCTKWVAESIDNFKWLLDLGLALCKEYTHRYGKHHKTEAVLNHIYYHYIDNIKATDFRQRAVGLTPFALAMPLQYQGDNVVDSYRYYYQQDKKDLLTYTNRDIPEWLDYEYITININELD